jgi:hypothetical protein
VPSDPDDLAALCAVIALAAFAVVIAIVRLMKSGRTVPPPWGPPPSRRHR